jgi:hypothetical protein
MTKLFVFVRRRPELTPEEFRASWRDVHGQLLVADPAFGAHVRRYVQSHAIPGASVPELVLSDFDCVDSLWFDSVDALTAALGDPGLAGLIERSAERFVDPAGTIQLVAEESVQWDRGFGRVKFVGLSRRHAGMSHDEWCRYWIEVHGPLAHVVPEFTRYYGRYVHNYVLPHDAGASGRVPEYDGIVEEWLESVEDMARCLAEPRYLEIVRPDELAFVDFARSHMLLTEEQVLHDA